MKFLISAKSPKYKIGYSQTSIPTFDECWSPEITSVINPILPATFAIIERVVDTPVQWPSQIYCMTPKQIEEGEDVGGGHGLYERDTQFMYINPNMDLYNIWANIVHEALHHALPDASEGDLDDELVPLIEEIAKGELDLSVLTKKTANDKTNKIVNFDGIKINIEWPAGSVREYEDSDYKRYMLYDYGYIRGVGGHDGEELDVFIGDEKDADKVYVIEQLAGLWEAENTDAELGDFDEYDIFIGFENAEEARNCFLLHYNPEQFGDVMEMGIDEFKDFVIEVLQGSTDPKELEENLEPAEL